MFQRKVILFCIATFVIIASSYVALALRAKSSTVSSASAAMGLDDDAPVVRMKTTDELITFWEQRFEHNPKDFISLTYLGQTYLRKGRETGDATAYQKAEAIFRKSLELNSHYEPTQAYLSTNLYVEHNFQGAFDLANQIYTTDPHALQALATMGDAQLELGSYQEANTTYQQLAKNVSGSAAVDSRLARLTWLQGRSTDAIALMQKAVDESTEAGLTGENAAWYHLQLGELNFNTNHLPQAEEQYSAALNSFDHYYLALAGLGKVRAAQGRYSEAIQYYEKAVAIIPQPDLLSVLGDLYSITGSPDKAKQEYDTVEFIGKLQSINKVIYNRLLVLFYTNHDRNLKEGLQLAQNELANRKDIYAYDTYAWALYKNGRYTEAAQAMQQALKLGTHDALLYYHAGMIYKSLGNNMQAQNMLFQALSINPHFDLVQARIAQNTLTSLQAQ